VPTRGPKLGPVQTAATAFLFRAEWKDVTMVSSAKRLRATSRTIFLGAWRHTDKINPKLRFSSPILDSPLSKITGESKSVKHMQVGGKSAPPPHRHQAVPSEVEYRH
jgi:hypothetical protein